MWMVTIVHRVLKVEGVNCGMESGESEWVKG